jgi:hypothetical protein
MGTVTMSTSRNKKLKLNPRLNKESEIVHFFSRIIELVDRNKISVPLSHSGPVLDIPLNPTMVPKDNYSIYFNGNSFDINFGENYKINVSNSNGMKLTVYFLKHPDLTEDLTVIREKLQLKLSDDNFDNTVKNLKDNIIEIQKMESSNPVIKKIPPDKRFSDYLSKYIRFNYSKRRIMINNYMHLKWESLPEEF